MQATEDSSYYTYTSPLHTLEEVLFHNEWTYERISENEITADAEARWCTYQLYAQWRPELESLSLTAFIDIKIPQDKRGAISALLGAYNPKIWMGHFELVPDEDLMAFRYALTLRGNPCATLEQIEEILSSAVSECDLIFPALQFVLWGGKNPEEALMAAMLETQGEA